MRCIRATFACVARIGAVLSLTEDLPKICLLYACRTPPVGSDSLTAGDDGGVPWWIWFLLVLLLVCCLLCCFLYCCLFAARKREKQKITYRRRGGFQKSLVEYERRKVQAKAIRMPFTSPSQSSPCLPRSS